MLHVASMCLHDLPTMSAHASDEDPPTIQSVLQRDVGG